MMKSSIELFLESQAFAVIGASANRMKYGNKVLRCYLQNYRLVYPVNPIAKSIEGLAVIPSIMALPETVQSISIVTPPAVTEQIVMDAIDKGINNLWMQPGAESNTAVQLCEEHGINVIAGGPCILVRLGYEEAKC